MTIFNGNAFFEGTLRGRFREKSEFIQVFKLGPNQGITHLIGKFEVRCKLRENLVSRPVPRD